MMVKSGEIAIFTSILLILSTILIFASLEGCRIIGSQFYLQMASDAAVESCFGEYYLPLWENYRLLCVFENKTLEERMEEYLLEYADAASNGIGVSFLGFKEAEATVSSAYITDDNANALYEEAIDHAGIHIPATALDALTSQEDFFENLQNITGLMGDLNDYSDDVLSEVNELASGNETETSDLMERGASLEDKLIEAASEFGLDEIVSENVDVAENESRHDTSAFPESSLKGLVGEAYLAYFTGGTEVSSAAISDESIISSEMEDDLGVISNVPEDENDFGMDGNLSSHGTDFLLFREYILDQLSGYTSVREGHALSYEWEYLLGGKTSDQSNLIYTINRLLLLRSGINFLEGVSDVQKRTEAETLAVTIAGITCSPLVIKMVQMGILAVWAANDAATEVQSLLSGGKVTLLEINGGSYLELDYKGYVRLLLYMKETETLSCRMLDVIQESMSLEDASFDIRRCVYSADISVTAESGTIFTRIISLSNVPSYLGRNISCSTSYTYDIDV